MGRFTGRTTAVDPPAVGEASGSCIFVRAQAQRSSPELALDRALVNRSRNETGAACV
jgi:hypothetical protein